MSVNIYLRDDFKTANGFTSKPYRDGSCFEMRIGSMSVWDDHGRPHIMHNIDNPIPEIVRNFVKEVSYHDSFPILASREFGRYQHKSVVATVDYSGPSSKHDNMPKFSIRAVAKKLEDIVEFVDLFRTGKIRPEESFEGPQDGKTRKELEDDVRRLQAEKEAFERERKALEYQSDQRAKNVQGAEDKFHTELKELRLFLIRVEMALLYPWWRPQRYISISNLRPKMKELKNKYA